MLLNKLHNEQKRFIINITISTFIRSKDYYALANLSIALKKHEMLQGIIINQMDNGNNMVSRLGLEGISNCSKVLDVLKFGIKALKHKGLRLVHS
jgi:hypothetical protein